MTTGAERSVAAAMELVESVVGAADSASACNVLLHHAVDACGYHRAAAVVDDGDRLRGVVQASPGEIVERLSAAYDEVRPAILNALESGEPVVVSNPASFPALGFASYLVFPLPGLEGPALGAVITESDVVDDEAAASADLFRRCGPPLARILELERLRAREARASQDRELLLGMVDTLPDPVVLTDRDNQILISNRRANELLTAGSGDPEGRQRAVKVNNLFLSSHLTQSAVSGPDERRVGELNLVDPEDGTDLVFEVFSRAATERSGEGKTVFTVLRDITDLKEALSELEDQIRRSRAAEQRTRRESERLEVIIENVGEPILVTDQHSNIILLNREAEYLFDVPEKIPDEAPEARAIRANDTKFTSLMSEFLMQPERRGSSTIEVEELDADETIMMEVMSTKIFDRRGEVSAVVSVLHDLTPFLENQRLTQELQTLNEALEGRVEDATEELAQRNQQLEEQRKKLEKASKAKSEFLAGVSHELRTPINAILGYTSLLLEGVYGDLSDLQVESLEKARSACDQLLELISDILDLSKIEAGKMSVNVEEFGLEEMTEDLFRTIEPMVRRKDLDFRTSYPDEGPKLRSDPTKLKQILLNLLSNAVKFTDDGFVSFRCSWIDGDDRLRFEVRDTGIGIDAEDLEVIFQEFHQTEQSRRDGRGGAGLGLTITRRLTTMLGGSVEAESTPGEGSVFRVEVPRHLEEPDPEAEAAAPSRPAAPNPGS